MPQHPQHVWTGESWEEPDRLGVEENAASPSPVLTFFYGFLKGPLYFPLALGLFVAPEGRKARKGGWLIACPGPHSMLQAHRRPDTASPLALPHQPSPRLR